MRSGLQDYNDTAYAAWTWANPDGDWSPWDILHALDKTFVCPPGECGVYSSVGFELLGLALVGVKNLTNWWDLDQADGECTVLPCGRLSCKLLAECH